MPTLLAGLFNSHVLSQSYNKWEIAQQIPFYDDIYPPLLVSDQNQTVHAFNSQLSQDQETTNILHRTWSVNTGWSKPLDIMFLNADMAPSQSLQGVILDQSGKFHLIFYTGSAANGTINYTKAWATEVDIAGNWSEPIEIAQTTGPLTNAVLTGNHIQDLYIVFVGKTDGVGLYEIHSYDNGETWSKPRQVTRISNTALTPYNIQLELDPGGSLHAVWSLINRDGLGEAVYYARKEYHIEDWSEPILIASREDNDYAADWPSIKYYEGELILMYMDGIKPGGIPPTRWMRRSQDNGLSWSIPIQPFPQVGENGIAVMLEDSGNNLHIILANRVGNPAVGGIWHGTWGGDTWSRLELITASSPIEAVAHGSYPEVGGASRPNAVLSQGNILLATWWHDMREPPPAGYSFTNLDTPKSPIVIPTHDSDLTAKAPQQGLIEPTNPNHLPTPTSLVTLEVNNTSPVVRPTIPIILSVLATLILVIGIVIFRRIL